MAEELGSLAVKIGLDNSGFQNGISQINKSLAVLNSEFKMNTAALGENAKGLDGLKLKSESLAQSMELQKQKVSALETAYNKSVESKGKDAKATQDLEIKLNNAKAALSNMGNELNKTNAEIEKQSSGWNKFGSSMQDIGGKLKTVGDSIGKVGSGLTTKLTVPLVGVGAAAIKVGMDFEAQMSRVQAISGATGDEFAKLNALALKLGQETAFSAGEAAKGMENLASAGFSTTEIMQAMPGMLDLAASSGEDLAGSADIAASTLRGFGLEAEQAGHVADVLAKNASATNASVRDTGEAMKYIAPVANAMGLSLEEVTASLGIMANAGIKGSAAGTTLRSALTSLADPSKEAASMMKELGFNAFDSQGKLLPLNVVIGNLKESTKGLTDQQKQQAISTIFGKEAMSGMLSLIQASPQELEKLTASLKNSDGAAKNMANTMQNNTKSAVEQMGGALETAGIKIEQSLAPTITKLANFVGDLADKFSALSPTQQEMIVKIGLIVAAIGPALMAIGGLISACGTIATAFGTVSTAVAAAGGVIAVLTGPIGIAIAAIAAIVAAGVLLYKNWDTIKAKAQELWAAITNSFNNIKNSVASIIGGIVQSFQNLPTLMLQIGQNIIAGLINGIVGYAKKAIQTVLDIANGIMSTFKSALGINSPSKIMQEYGQYIDEGLENGMNQGKDSVLETAKSIASGIEESIKVNIDKLEGFARQVVDAIKNQYEQLETAQLNSLDTQIENQKKASEAAIKMYDEEYMAKLKLIDKEAYDKTQALQKEIEAINVKTEEEEKILREQEQDKRQLRLEQAVEEAKNDDARKTAKEELNSFLLAREREKILEERNAQKESLKEEISAIKENTEKKKEELKLDYDNKKKNEEDKTKEVINGLFSEKEATKNHYTELKSTENLEAEARKLILNGNQADLVKLLNSYAPEWQNAGQSLSSKIVNGLNSEKQTAQSAISEMINVKSHVEEQSKALTSLNKEIDVLEANAKKASTASGGATGSFDKLGISALGTSSNLKDLTLSENGVADAANKTATNVSNSNASMEKSIDGLVAKNSYMQTSLISIWNNIKSSIESVWNAIVSTTTTTWNNISTTMTTAWNTIKSTVEVAINSIKTTIETIWNAIQSTTATIFTGIQQFLTTIWNAYKTLITMEINAIKTVIETAWNIIKTVTESVWNAIKSFLESLFNALKALITTIWNGIKSTIETSWNSIKATTTSVWNSIKSTIEGIANAVKSIVTTVWNAIKAVTESVWNAIKSTVESITNAIKSAVTSIWNAIKANTESTWNSIKSTLENIINTIKTNITNSLQSVKDWVSSTWSGIQSALVAPVQAAANAISSVVSGIVSSVQSALSAIASLSSAKVSSGSDKTSSGGKSGSSSGGSSSGGKTGKSDRNASGTRSLVGGFTTLHERGYELYDLPGGTRVYPHEASESLVLKTAEAVARNVASKVNSGITQNVVINSPTALSPSEIARANRRALQELALQF